MQGERFCTAPVKVWRVRLVVFAPVKVWKSRLCNYHYTVLNQVGFPTVPWLYQTFVRLSRTFFDRPAFARFGVSWLYHFSGGLSRTFSTFPASRRCRWCSRLLLGCSCWRVHCTMGYVESQELFATFHRSVSGVSARCARCPVDSAYFTRDKPKCQQEILKKFQKIRFMRDMVTGTLYRRKKSKTQTIFINLQKFVVKLFLPPLLIFCRVKSSKT